MCSLFYEYIFEIFFDNFMDTLKQPLNWYFKVVGHFIDVKMIIEDVYWVMPFIDV